MKENFFRLNFFSQTFSLSTNISFQLTLDSEKMRIFCRLLNRRNKMQKIECL